jgi:tetratricopeptide (TPR) repeat protein
MTRIMMLALILAAPVVGAQEPAAVSLLGRPLLVPPLTAEMRAGYEESLARAQADFDRDPYDEEAIIWLGRRTAYLGRYREAIAIYSRGLTIHPDSARLLRHRGHRYLTVRKIAEARADLEKAARLIRGVPDEIEPDGIPNAKNTPTSTLHFNVHYHLALAWYVSGDLKQAHNEWGRCLEVSRNNDSKVASSHWLYTTLRRMGKDKEAVRLLDPIGPGLEVIESQDYLDLLLMYKGSTTPAALLEGKSGLPWVTRAYGAAEWHRCNGRVEEGRRLLEQIVDEKAVDHPWGAFGYLAAEAALAAEPVRPGR